MKINSTSLTFMLIILGSLGAGITTTILAYKFGSESLETVQFPEENPAQKLAIKNSANQGFQIINEKKILVQVYDYVHAQKEASKNKKPQPKTSDNQQSSRLKEKTVAQNSPSQLLSKTFVPIKVQNEGITMEVANIQEQQGSLLLSVNLQNDSHKDVKFLYSFLDIKDEKNRSISAITNGLPTDLPANGQSFSGEISIPLSLLNNSQKISLNLPNYPEQNLNLQIPAIPILR